MASSFNTALRRTLVLACAFTVLAGVRSISAQEDEPTGSTTMFDRPATDRFWLSGQMNVIFQTHPSFPSPYSSDHSLRPDAEHATSTLLTVYTGIRLLNSTEFILNVESAGGRGLSDALGLAGFTNLDVVRNPTLGAAPYLARVMLHQTIAIGSERTDVEPNPLAFSRS